jgi:hypothetical protein
MISPSEKCNLRHTTTLTTYTGTSKESGSEIVVI